MATQQIWRDLGTPLVFNDSAGLTLKNLAFGVGRVSARIDRGAGDKPVLHLCQAVIQFETAPIVGEVVEIWLFESDGTYADGVVGTADAALTAGSKQNGKLIGVCLAETTGTATNNVASFVFEIWQRYYSIGVWNASAGDNLEDTTDASRIIVTPMAYDIQASA